MFLQNNPKWVLIHPDWILIAGIVVGVVVLSLTIPLVVSRIQVRRLRRKLHDPYGD